MIKTSPPLRCRQGDKDTLGLPMLHGIVHSLLGDTVEMDSDSMIGDMHGTIAIDLTGQMKERFDTRR